MTPGSPFKAGGSAVDIPISPGADGFVLIRVSDADLTNKIVFKIGGLASSTNAGGYLYGKEGIKISINALPRGHDHPLTVLNVSGDPDIYWSII